MEQKKYANGSLFTNKNKTTDTHPDYAGQLEVTRDVVENLYTQMQEGVLFPKMSLGAWKREAKKSGEVFLSVKGSIDTRRSNQSSPPPQRSSNNDPFEL